MNPSRKLPEACVFIIPQVILIHLSECQWEVVVYSPKRILRRIGEVRIFVLITHQAHCQWQVIRIHFDERKVTVICRPRRGAKLLQCHGSCRTRPWE